MRHFICLTEDFSQEKKRNEIIPAVFIYINTHNNELRSPSCQKQGTANSCCMVGVEEDIIMSATFHQQIKQNTLGCHDEDCYLVI